MSIWSKLAPRPRPRTEADFDDGTIAHLGTPAGMGTGGGAKDVTRSLKAQPPRPELSSKRTHTGLLPAEFISPVAMSVEQRQTVAMAVSILLTYPGDAYAAKLNAVREQLAYLPEAVREDIEAFCQWATDEGPRRLEEHYVETFDQRRRCSLFLSYYAVGDTRQRGMAILSFQQQLESLGFEMADEQELPDHLCVVLEALAMAPEHDKAVEFVASYRDGIEVLRSALLTVSSPYAHLIAALCRSLPEIDEETAQKYVDLIRTGPPAEMVGIADLPFPTVSPDLT